MTDSSNHEIERRQSFRLDMEKELVDINWTDANGQLRQKKVACRDFSKGGLRIDSDIEIPSDTEITVTFKANTTEPQQVQGKVIRCFQLDNGWYEVAFQFDKIV